MSQITAEHIYQKAVSVLAERLEPIDLLFLQECIDGDPQDGFFEELTRVVAEMYPECFCFPPGHPRHNLSEYGEIKIEK